MEAVAQGSVLSVKMLFARGVRPFGSVQMGVVTLEELAITQVPVTGHCKLEHALCQSIS